MSFTLRQKKYGISWLVGLPFACQPFCTVFVMVQKALTGLANVLWILVEAAFIDLALECVTGTKSLRDGLPLLAAMLLIVFWKRMGYSFGRLACRKVETEAAYQLHAEAVKKRARLHFRLIEDEAAWELCRRVSDDMKRKVWQMMQFSGNLLVAGTRIGGTFLLIFAENVRLGTAIFLASVPVIVYSVYSGKQNYKAFREASVFARRGEYLQKILTDRESADERNLNGYTEYVDGQWREQRRRYEKISMKAKNARERRSVLTSVLTNTISTVMVLFLAAALAEGNLSIGIFISLSKAVYDMINLMHNEISRSLTILAEHAAYLQDLTAFANLEETEGTGELPAEKTPVFETLEFENVTFRYPGTERDILKGLNLKLERGKHYAFVGENGAGKTTLTKLLTGLYDNYGGRILLNGRELREYSAAEIKAFFSGVYQDFAHYYDTVANNVLIGDVRHMETAEAENRMKEYLEELDVYDELRSLPQGTDTALGKLEEGSADLSGGQWQRVAMARSLMSPAPVQLLDEPTAALDPVSESRLYGEFEKISRGRTTVFISHRLGSTRLADKIFVLEDGRVAEQGSHAELMEHGGLYAEMYQSQKSWYEDTQKGGDAV